MAELILLTLSVVEVENMQVVNKYYEEIIQLLSLIKWLHIVLFSNALNSQVSWSAGTIDY